MPSIFSSTELWEELVSIRTQIKNEREKYAGVTNIENDKDRLAFNDRMTSLWKEYERVKQEYDIAIREESGIATSTRVSRLRDAYNGN